MVRRSNGDCVADSGGVSNGVGDTAGRESKSRRFGRCIYVSGREAARMDRKGENGVDFVRLRLVETSLSFFRDP